MLVFQPLFARVYVNLPEDKTYRFCGKLEKKHPQRHPQKPPAPNEKTFFHGESVHPT